MAQSACAHYSRHQRPQEPPAHPPRLVVAFGPWVVFLRVACAMCHRQGLALFRVYAGITLFWLGIGSEPDLRKVGDPIVGTQVHDDRAVLAAVRFYYAHAGYYLTQFFLSKSPLPSPALTVEVLAQCSSDFWSSGRTVEATGAPAKKKNDSDVVLVSDY